MILCWWLEWLFQDLFTAVHGSTMQSVTIVQGKSKRLRRQYAFEVETQQFLNFHVPPHCFQHLLPPFMTYILLDSTNNSPSNLYNYHSSAHPNDYRKVYERLNNHVRQKHPKKHHLPKPRSHGDSQWISCLGQLQPRCSVVIPTWGASVVVPMRVQKNGCSVWQLLVSDLSDLLWFVFSPHSITSRWWIQIRNQT